MNIPRPTANTTAYINPNFADPFIIERVTSARDLEKFAPAICNLMISAYGASTEDPNGPLPQGTLALEYGEGRSREVLKALRQDFVRGAQFWLSWNDAKDELVGLAETIPDHPNRGDFNLIDVVVRPSLQREGRGSMLAHTALKYSGYGGRRLTFDTFLINTELEPVYEDKGMKTLGRVRSRDFVNGGKLGVRRYASPEGLTVSGVVAILEARHEYLAHGYQSPRTA